MPTSTEYLRIVSSNQNSVEFEGASMTCTPIAVFADHLEMASEISEPPNPITPANTSKEPRFRPLALRYGSTPSSRMVIDNTSMMAKLVARKRTMRFMEVSLLRKVVCSDY